MSIVVFGSVAYDTVETTTGGANDAGRLRRVLLGLRSDWIRSRLTVGLRSELIVRSV